ncbi:hypothetical protein BVX94_00755 [bacterium B17]|nr:hypothetical protein BVX94_00755 [bacterium B17]
MSEPLKVLSYRGEYVVEQTDNIIEALQKELQDEDFIIADANVLELYPDLAAIVADRPHRSITPSEEEKSYEALIPVIRELIERRFTKAGRLIAIGGGIIQDITAFIASVFMRGVDWVFVPTTLLAQCDSCIGSKTSINFEGYKNQVGGFFPPRLILIDKSFLATLPPLEIRSGLGEMLHYFVVSGEEDFAWASPLIPQAFSDADIMQELVHRSLSIKKAMIEIDEFDKGPRNVFNYGHSFGHAMESALNYTVPHGVAVSIGIDMANTISVKEGLLDEATRLRIRQIAKIIWDDTNIDPIDVDRFIAALRRDKKNEGKDIKVILTRGLGDTFKTDLKFTNEIQELISSYLTDRKWENDE